MSSKARTLVKGSALRSLSFFLQIIVALFMMPFIIHSLGDRMYGLWIFIGSFLGFYGLFDFGLSSAVQRYISRALGNRDYKKANIVANTSFFIFLMFGLLVLFISIIVAITVPLFVKDIAEIVLFRTIVIILGASLAISFPMRVFSGILSSYLRFDLIVYVELSKLLSRTVLVVIFLKMGYGVLALALITFTVNIVSYIINFIFSKRIARYIIISKKFIDKSHIKYLLKYSSSAFIIKIADKLRFKVDYFVIAAFMGLNFITVYSIASRLIRCFIEFISTAVGIMSPVFSQYEGKGDYVSIREKFILTTKISSYLSILVGGTLIIFGRAFIERWMGKEYLAAYPLLIVLVVPIIFALMQSPSIQLLYGISKHKFFAILNSIEGVANLILSLILVRKFGLMGVALGTAIPMIIIKLFIQPVYACKVIKLDIWKYYFSLLAPTLLKSLAILTILYWIFRNSIMPNYSNLLILIFCEFILFLVIIFFIGINSVERKYFRNIILKPIFKLTD